MKSKALAVAALIVGFANPAVAGSIIMSVDRAAFAAAIAGGTISSQDFEGLAALSILGNTPDVSYFASQGDPIVTASFLTTTAPNGLGSTSADLNPSIPDEFFLGTETATFVFTEAITAFAVDINTFATADGAYSASLSTGDVVTSVFEVFPGQITGQFIGFVSDTPLTFVTIAALTGFSFTLDTLVYGDASAVVIPLPGALLLLLGALPALGLRRKETA